MVWGDLVRSKAHHVNADLCFLPNLPVLLSLQAMKQNERWGCTVLHHISLMDLCVRVWINE